MKVGENKHFRYWYYSFNLHNITDPTSNEILHNIFIMQQTNIQ